MFKTANKTRVYGKFNLPLQQINLNNKDMKQFRIIREIKKDGARVDLCTITTKNDRAAAVAYLSRLATIAQNKPRFVRVRLFTSRLRAVMGDRTEYNFYIR